LRGHRPNSNGIGVERGEGAWQKLGVELGRGLGPVNQTVFSGSLTGVVLDGWSGIFN
jgi:hypothetical protein